MKTLVIGVGNLLRCDDGVGIHVVNRLKAEAPEIDAVDLSTASIEILEAMRGYDRVIVVDAIKTGAEPGTILRVNVKKEGRIVPFTGTHDLDLLTTLRLGKVLFPREMPRELIILAVEAEDISTFSESCTEKVHEAIDQIVRTIISLVSDQKEMEESNEVSER